jgi:hypothetical protein
MKTKALKKLLITFSIVLSASYVIVFACAGGDWDWFGNSSFTPETFVDADYNPLLYSPYEMFYGIGYDGDHITKFSEEITKDWTTFMENKIKPDQLTYFLLSDSSKVDIDGLYQFFTNKTKNASSNKWTGKMNLNDQKIKDFIQFLYVARKVEECSTINYDPWDYDNKTEAPKVDDKLISDIQNKYETVSNPFLKNRYWFQTIKANFYGTKNTEAITFFEKTKNDVPKNTLYYRAVAYVAGIYKQNNDYAQANYNYSIVFDKCPDMLVTATYNFHPQEENDWNAALSLAKTNDEKAALWAILGYYADAGRSISEIYKLNPQSPHLDYLLTRLINIMEENIQIAPNESPTKYKTRIKEKLNKKDLETVTSIAQSGKIKNIFLWNTGAAYLQTLNGNYAEAKNLFAKAEKQMSSTEMAKGQLRLLRLINTLSEINDLNASAENNILPELNWLYKQKTEGLRSDAAIDWSKKYISALYASRNNVILAEMFNPNKDFYKDNEKLEVMRSFLSKPDRTAFEKFAESLYSITLSDIYDYQAVMFAYENKMELAFENMGKANKIKDEEFPGNPFNGNIKDCNECDHKTPQKTKFSKLRFIEVVKIMQSKVEKGEDLYNNYLLLGNAFYNISYFGNGRFFYQIVIIGEYDTYYDKMISSMSNAKMYYKKALEAAANDEQRAKCNYLLSKCERNEFYNSNTQGNADFLAWDGFVKLKTKYANTKYYKDVIRDCGYFSTFISNSR